MIAVIGCSKRRIEGNKISGVRMNKSFFTVSHNNKLCQLGYVGNKEVKALFEKWDIIFYYVKICPNLPCIERIFPIWGVFEGVLVHPCPTATTDTMSVPRDTVSPLWQPLPYPLDVFSWDDLLKAIQNDEVNYGR